MTQAKKKPVATKASKQLRQALIAQRLCCHKEHIVDWLLRQNIQHENVPAGTILIRENDIDHRDVFCIISGRFAIDVGGHYVDHREATHIGEMAMILDEARTASATAVVDSKVVRIPEATMLLMYDEFPETWEPIAKTLCERLNQRRKFFRTKNEVPKVFIGSSGAALKVGKKLAQLLRQKIGNTAKFDVWDGPPIFTPSSVTINQLIERAKGSDFGIFIFAADDNAKIKGKNKMIPRDNVIFEGGLFTAACGLNRTFFVREDSKELHLLTDLAGVTTLNFSRDDKGNNIKFGDTVRRIVTAIQTQGVI
jgi:CRP/FNR family cyclic AMP-dependent transcriptional regulator